MSSRLTPEWIRRSITCLKSSFHKEITKTHMFAELITGVKVLGQAIGLASKGSSAHGKRKKDKLVLDLLMVYFCLLRVVRNGRELLAITGKKSVKAIACMAETERTKFLNDVYRLLMTQRLLLRELSALIYDKPIIDILDSSLRDELEALVGSKESGLLAIGAALEFYFLFGGRSYGPEVKKHGQEIADIRYQSGIAREVLYGIDDRASIRDARKNMGALARATERFRASVEEAFESAKDAAIVTRAKKRADAI